MVTLDQRLRSARRHRSNVQIDQERTRRRLSTGQSGVYETPQPTVGIGSRTVCEEVEQPPLVDRDQAHL